MAKKIGSPVEDFELANIDGEKVTLQEVLTGKKGAVVVFWSSICSHCSHYDGYLNGFTVRRPEIGIVAVASRQRETASQLRTNAMRRRLTFPILHDPTGKVAQRWFALQTPLVFLLDPNHVLLYRGAIDNRNYPRGPKKGSYLDTAIDEFLAARPVTRHEIANFGCAIESGLS
jgi:peroxiredoxin